ncbi:TIGR02206 family membrane protein [Citricoccus nitrophenolicus]|uniref:TMEM164-related integral membrane acyltransferase n=1 Tax=Citricoccus nitrophenolicus TaxID=863575 RepID=UPI0039B5493C
MSPFLDPLAPYIPLFGTDHLLALGAVLAALALMLVFRRQVRDHASVLRWAFLMLALAQQVALYWYQVAVAGWDWGDSTPLHISRVTTLILMAYLITGRRAVLEVGFYFGLYAYATFLYPQRIQPLDHLMGWSFLVSHAVTILVPVFAGISYGWRPTLRGLRRAYGWFVVYFVVVLAVNAMTGGNYFYLKYRPFLRDLPDPLYWLAACAATLALMWVGYAVSRRFPVRGDAGYATETAATGSWNLSART